MKIKLFLASLCLLFLVSCDYFAPLKLKSTTKDYLVNEVLQDKSYKVEVKKIIYDTVPEYFLPVYDKVLNFTDLSKDLIDNFYEYNSEEFKKQCSKLKKAQGDAKIDFTIKSVQYSDHKSYIVYAEALKSEGSSQKFIVVIDEDHVVNYIELEKIKSMILFMHMAYTMPLNIDSDGLIDFAEADNWLDNHEDNIKSVAERFYLKNLKYFN